MRVMFVDDEPGVLSDINAMLASRNDDWEVTFAGSGPQALEHLTDEPYDIVVTDLDMPEMDGAELLRRINRLYPDTVRIVLGDDTHRDWVLRAVPVAQQFLHKPCDIDALEQIVYRAYELSFEVQHDRLREMISRIDRLPSVPEVYVELAQALASDRTTAREVGCIIEHDPALAAKVLQVVNSAFFRRGKVTKNTHDAVARLGMDTIKGITLAANVFDNPDFAAASASGFSMYEFQSDALLVSELARRLPSQAEKSDLMTAGLMHDIGRLLIASQLPDEFQRILELRDTHQIPMLSAEHEVLGVSHAEVGGHLLSLWGLPEGIVEAVSWHHLGPRWQSEPVLDLAATLYVAVCLARGTEVDQDLADSWGIVDPLPEWRAIAADLGAVDPLG